jgi:ankyrin repeat protein
VSSNNSGANVAEEYDMATHYTALHYVAASGHEVTVETLLDLNANIDGISPSFPLLQALPSSARVEAIDDEQQASDGLQRVAPQPAHAEQHQAVLYHNTPLHYAAANGNLAIVRLLLNRGATIDARTTRSTTRPSVPSAVASSAPILDIPIALEDLASYPYYYYEGNGTYANLHDQPSGFLQHPYHRKIHAQRDNHNTNFYNPLHKNYPDAYYASTRSPLRVANSKTEFHNGTFLRNYNLFAQHRLTYPHLKLRIPYNPNTHYTPLHMAVCNNHRLVAKLLISRGSSVNATSSCGDSPLHLAACGGFTSMLSLLLDRKANVNAVTSNLDTPLHFAASGGFIDSVQLLLEREADPNALNIANHTPVHWAALSGQPLMPGLLLDRKGHVNFDRSDSPLHFAASVGNIAVARLLLHQKANIDGVDMTRKTPLHWAMAEGQTEMIELLIERKADMDIADALGETVLHHAAQECYNNTVRLLVTRRADITRTNVCHRCIC